MVAQKVDHGGQDRAIAKPGAQRIGRKARQRQQARGAILVGQGPAQR